MLTELDLMQTRCIILHVAQGFSLAQSNPKGLPYKIFIAFEILRNVRPTEVQLLISGLDEAHADR